VGVPYLNYRLSPSTLLLVQELFRIEMVVPGSQHPPAFKHLPGTATRDNSTTKVEVPTSLSECFLRSKSQSEPQPLLTNTTTSERFSQLTRRSGQLTAPRHFPSLSLK